MLFFKKCCKIDLYLKKAAKLAAKEKSFLLSHEIEDIRLAFKLNRERYSVGYKEQFYKHKSQTTKPQNKR